MSVHNCMFRTSDKFYTSRPPANCLSAREAWDIHLKGGPIKRLRLLDGYLSEAPGQIEKEQP